MAGALLAATILLVTSTVIMLELLTAEETARAPKGESSK